jgi:hypothetical protein
MFAFIFDRLISFVSVVRRLSFSSITDNGKLNHGIE